MSRKVNTVLECIALIGWLVSYLLILLQGNYVLPWQNASLQNYPGPPGGSQFSGQPSRNYNNNNNNNQPRLPALPEPREDGRYQDPADLFRQFADQQDGGGGGDPNAGVANSNTNSANNRNSNSANSNATITVSGTTRRTTAR